MCDGEVFGFKKLGGSRSLVKSLVSYPVCSEPSIVLFQDDTAFPRSLQEQYDGKCD